MISSTALRMSYSKYNLQLLKRLDRCRIDLLPLIQKNLTDESGRILLESVGRISCFLDVFTFSVRFISFFVNHSIVIILFYFFIRHRFEEFTMAPDSLECDPWSLSNEPEAQIESWSLSCDLHERKSMSDNLHHESLYQDSLNPPINHRLNEYMHLQAGYIKLHS